MKFNKTIFYKLFGKVFQDREGTLERAAAFSVDSCRRSTYRYR